MFTAGGAGAVLAQGVCVLCMYTCKEVVVVGRTIIILTMCLAGAAAAAAAAAALITAAAAAGAPGAWSRCCGYTHC
jgi:hypothetical protein